MQKTPRPQLYFRCPLCHGAFRFQELAKPWFIPVRAIFPSPLQCHFIGTQGQTMQATAGIDVQLLLLLYC